MGNDYNYINRYNREHYDRINLLLPSGYKKRIQERTEQLDISVNGYITALIRNDLNNQGLNFSNQSKKGVSDEDKILLDKMQIAKKYYEMIEEVSFSKETGYFIRLKTGYINDEMEGREIYTRTSHDMRLVITKSHRIGESVKRKAAKDEPVIDWLTEEELDQLKRWQVPKKYYSAIQSIQYDDTGANIIVLKDGFINDTSNMNIIRFDTVTELRSIMKLTHRVEGG